MQRARESGLSYRPLAKRTGLLKKHRPASGRNKAATSTKKNGHSGHRSGHSAQKVDFTHTTRDDRRHFFVKEHRTKMDCEEGTPRPKKSRLREGGGQDFTKLFLIYLSALRPTSHQTWPWPWPWVWAWAWPSSPPLRRHSAA